MSLHFFCFFLIGWLSLVFSSLFFVSFLIGLLPLGCSSFSFVLPKENEAKERARRGIPCTPIKKQAAGNLGFTEQLKAFAVEFRFAWEVRRAAPPADGVAHLVWEIAAEI